MTDLIQRLHKQAVNRGVAIRVFPRGTGTDDGDFRHPLEIAHELLATLKRNCCLEWWDRHQWRYATGGTDVFQSGTFIECVVVLAACEQKP